MRVSIVDYGAGNVFSVAMALSHVGATDVQLSADAKTLAMSDALVLPGVGAFGSGVSKIRALQLEPVIAAFVRTGRPVLGICLGMQMLARVSEEFGERQGLNLIPGRVVALPSPHSGQYKVPYVGWVEIRHRSSTSNTPLDALRDGDCVYLVHSYHFVPDDPSVGVASACYGDLDVVIAVRQGNLLGVQFHPEKSGEVGLRMLERFVMT